MSDKTKVKITKIVKGFGEKIGSTESYSSFEFSPIIIEAEVDIDITTQEGKDGFKKISDGLFKFVRAAHDRDIEHAKEKYPELSITLEKKHQNGLR